MRFEESPATEEEDSYEYRIEWDDHWTTDFNPLGAGSRELAGFDNAWECFLDYKHDGYHRGVRLIQIDKDGNERIYAE